MSLNFAGFAHVMAADAALSRSQRLLRLVLRLFHGRFQLERLVRFNAKFLPRWQPRYLVYDGLDLPAPLGPSRAPSRGLPSRLQTRLGGGSPFDGAPGWLRGATAAAAICVGLTASSCLWGTDHATARPLRVHAEDASLRLVFRLRQTGRPDPGGVPLSAEGPARHPPDRAPQPDGRVIRMDPLHRGDLSMPMRLRPRRDLGHVLGPKRFRSQLDAVDSLPARTAERGPREVAARPGARRRLPRHGDLRRLCLRPQLLGLPRLPTSLRPARRPGGQATSRSISTPRRSAARTATWSMSRPAFSSSRRGAYRFPVLYLLHGTVSNALHYINVGRVGVNLDELLAAGRIRPFLIVMPESSDGSFIDDTEWANTSHGSYESAVMEVVQQVDRALADHREPLGPRHRRALDGRLRRPQHRAAPPLHLRDDRELVRLLQAEAHRRLLRLPPRPSSASTARPPTRRRSPPALQSLPLHVFLYAGAQDRADPSISRVRPGAKAPGGRRSAPPSRPGVHDWRLWRTEMPAALRYCGELALRSRPLPLTALTASRRFG